MLIFFAGLLYLCHAVARCTAQIEKAQSALASYAQVAVPARAALRAAFFLITSVVDNYRNPSIQTRQLHVELLDKHLFIRVINNSKPEDLLLLDLGSDTISISARRCVRRHERVLSI